MNAHTMALEICDDKPTQLPYVELHWNDNDMLYWSKTIISANPDLTLGFKGETKS